MKNYNKIFVFFLAFIALQPVFDIFSFAYLRGYMPFAISTYVKPLVVFGIGAYLFFTMPKSERKKWFIYYILIVVLLLGHFTMLYRIFTFNWLLKHEFRFVLNIMYSIISFMNIYILFKYKQDKSNSAKMIEKTIFAVVVFYSLITIFSIVTGSSSLTYEYADPNKLGFKGYFDSGQILGHTLSILYPFVLYFSLNNIKRIYLSLISIALPTIVMLFLGTKVPYYILIIELVIYVLSVLFVHIVSKSQKMTLKNFTFVLISLAISILLYQSLPVAFNTNINSNVFDQNWDSMNQNLSKSKKDFSAIKKEIMENGTIDLTQESFFRSNVDLQYYHTWHLMTLEEIESRHLRQEVNPWDNRLNQHLYNSIKFNMSDWRWKVVGLGYINQPIGLELERDLFMVLFNFGFMGFILFLGFYITIWIYSSYKIIINLSVLNLKLLSIYTGYSAFFFISGYAGYTFIYTNFSLFLALLSILLYHNVKELS